MREFLVVLGCRVSGCSGVKAVRAAACLGLKACRSFAQACCKDP